MLHLDQSAGRAAQLAVFENQFNAELGTENIGNVRDEIGLGLGQLDHPFVEAANGFPGSVVHAGYDLGREIRVFLFRLMPE